MAPAPPLPPPGRQRPAPSLPTAHIALASPLLCTLRFLLSVLSARARLPSALPHPAAPRALASLATLARALQAARAQWAAAPRRGPPPLPCVLLEELEVQGFAPLARSAAAAPAYTAALSLRPVFLFETGRSPEGGYGSQPTMRTAKRCGGGLLGSKAPGRVGGQWPWTVEWATRMPRSQQLLRCGRMDAVGQKQVAAKCGGGLPLRQLLQAKDLQRGSMLKTNTLCTNTNKHAPPFLSFSSPPIPLPLYSSTSPSHPPS